MPLTIRQIKTAEANGIPIETLKYRYHNGWDHERMVTEPPRRFEEWKEYKEICEQHGISKIQFYERVTIHGMDPEEASTKPLITRHADRSRKHPAEYLDMARANGISTTAYYYRINTKGMSYLEAATRPTNRKRRA